MVSEVGRQPWIVYNLMKVEDAATGNTGVWVTFIGVIVLYTALGVHHRVRAARHEPPLPPQRGGRRDRRLRRETSRTGRRAGPSRVPTLTATWNRRRCRREHGGRRRAVHRHPRLRRLRRGRLRRRVLGPRRRWHPPRWSSASGDRPFDRSGVGGEPRVVDLRLRRALDELSRGVRVDHPDPVRPVDDRRVRHRAARRELRVPQGGAARRGNAVRSARCSLSRR